MPDTPYWRAHVRVDQDPLSTLTFTRARDEGEDAGDVSAEAGEVYRELIGLPEDWTVHVQVSTLAGPEDARGPAAR